MSYVNDLRITSEGPIKSFTGKVNKKVQRVEHERYGECYRVWFGGGGPILFQKTQDSITEVGILPLDYKELPKRTRALIKWAIDHYEGEQTTLDLGEQS